MAEKWIDFSDEMSPDGPFTIRHCLCKLSGCRTPQNHIPAFSVLYFECFECKALVLI